MHRHIKIKRSVQGFTFLEVLVAVVVVSLGMLGIAATLFASVRGATSGYTRQVAVQYAYDIIDRMRANQVEAAQAGGAYTATAVAPSSTSPQSCNDATCTAAQMATYDVWDWQTQLAQNLPQGLGSITITTDTSGISTVTVTITWQDTAGTSAFAQGSGGYSTTNNNNGTNLGSYTVVTSLTPLL
ncbi:type IV pilus modification protein PilV [Dyella flava]|uniref:Type IV pilus modification protein PilV n=1 Tax=Dyella flava TaxID=1920170 RepID=A0ABS2K5L3_9GAMM|nr:type IV pilus modification protein PilV [Dyella flava]MBM7126497.1 type IV pilus modification protein PilV [Dyella flava]GLQ49685.1 hypothetical protein GCM10010872_11340 [Dyella flava]